MKNKSLLFVMVLFFICKDIFAADVSIFIDGTKKKLSAIELDKNIFVNYEHFFKLFDNKLKKTNDGYKLLHKNISIITYPNSFYILLDNDTDRHIIQLQIPVYELKNILYIPINSVLFGLREFFNIKYDILKNDIYINFNDTLRNYFKESKEDEKNNQVKIVSYSTPEVTIIPLQDNKLERRETLFISPKSYIDEKKITNIESDIEFAVSVNELMNIKSQNMITNYSLENINKPALSSLSYSDKNFIINKQVRQLFDRNNIEHTQMESNPDLPILLPTNEIQLENKALPPFRKYTIPNHIKKEVIEDLK